MLAGAQGVDYVAPNFRKDVFDPDKILLGKSERRLLCSALTAAAANFPEDKTGVSFQLKEMALAIALRLDAAHLGAQKTHRSLVKKQRPVKIPAFDTKVMIADRLRKTSMLLSDAEAVSDEKVLSCYLLDIARHLDPLNTEGIALLKRATTSAKYPGWGGVLNSAVSDGFLFPTEGETNTANGGPATPDTPPEIPEPAGDPESDLKATESAALFLGFEKSASGALVGGMVKISLKVDPSIREAGQPVRVLFPTPPLQDEIPLGQSNDSVISALSRIYPDWPASGRKIIARFSPEYLAINKKSGELALALALDSLFSGTPSKVPTAAVGMVTPKGGLGGVDALPRRVRYLQNSALCERLIIPTANEADLMDILIAGSLKPLLRLQVFKASTLAEALKISRSDFTPEEQKALLDFIEIRNVAGRSTSPSEIIRTEIVKSRLAEIVAAMPTHVSASLLLRYASGDLPPRMSDRGSVDELRTIIFPYTQLLKSQELLSGAQAESLRAKTSAKLTSLREKLATNAVPVGDKVNDYATKMEAFAKLNSKTSAKALDLKASIDATWKAIKEDLKTLSNPPAQETP